MQKTGFLPWWGRATALLALCVLFAASPVRAQSLPGSAESFWVTPPTLTPNDFRNWASGVTPAFAPPERAARIRLFGMPTGFLSEPLGLDPGFDDPLPDPDHPTPPDDDPEGRRVQLTFGNDNPYFDLRRPGTPGGIGYYKLDSQYQLIDGDRMGLTVNLSAVTPAGLEANGVADGPTILTPSIAWFQDLGGGTALQGYVGKNIQANAQWVENWHASVHYGFAMQCPVPGFCPSNDRGVFFFVETLGRYRLTDSDLQSRRPHWEIIPGFHWRLSDALWFTVGPTRQGLLTCSWRF